MKKECVLLIFLILTIPLVSAFSFSDFTDYITDFFNKIFGFEEPQPSPPAKIREKITKIEEPQQEETDIERMQSVLRGDLTYEEAFGSYSEARNAETGCACGDIDNSGFVDLNDFSIFANCFNLVGPAGDCSTQDFFCSNLDGSGKVDLNDFSIFANLYGLVPPGQYPPNCGQQTSQCTDGIDNDQDDLTDEQDPDCKLTNYECNIDNVLFKIDKLCGANVATYTSKYPYSVCSLGNAQPRTCDGSNSIVKLSREINAHAQKSNINTYPTEICYGNLECDYANDCSSLGNDYQCLASMSGQTKAHVAECPVYPLKICCRNANILDTTQFIAECGDGIDNDGDGYTDFNGLGQENAIDTSCTCARDDDESLPSYECSDGEDNDNDDGAMDFAHPSGAEHDFSCSSPFDNDETWPKAQCQDELDNECGQWQYGYPKCDKYIDHDSMGFPNPDPDCTSQQDNTEDVFTPGLTKCSDGIDNDGDGYSDANDFSCKPSGTYIPWKDDETYPLAECQDGIDNDNDLYVDYGDEPTLDCSSTQDNSENIFTPGRTQCSNYIDDDGDFLVDMLDPGCSSQTDNDEYNEPIIISPNCRAIVYNGDLQNSVNLVFVPANFGPALDQAFPIEVVRDWNVINNYIPFNISPNINVLYVTIENDAALNCHAGCSFLYPEYICCDIFASLALSSECTSGPRQTMVIYDDPVWSGLGWHSYDFAVITTNNGAPLIATHELGHSLLNLGDEEHGVGTPESSPNCDYADCPKWSDLIGHWGVDCRFNKCRNGDYFASEATIMNGVILSNFEENNERIGCCVYRQEFGIEPGFCRKFDNVGVGLDIYCDSGNWAGGGAGTVPNPVKYTLVKSKKGWELIEAHELTKNGWYKLTESEEGNKLSVNLEREDGSEKIITFSDTQPVEILTGEGGFTYIEVPRQAISIITDNPPENELTALKITYPDRFLFFFTIKKEKTFDLCKVRLLTGC